jgi:hypothetical protein
MMASERTRPITSVIKVTIHRPDANAL